jgi:hypothetical protein
MLGKLARLTKKKIVDDKTGLWKRLNHAGAFVKVPETFWLIKKTSHDHHSIYIPLSYDHLKII